jgi:hypothetical protein
MEKITKTEKNMHRYKTILNIRCYCKYTNSNYVFGRGGSFSQKIESANPAQLSRAERAKLS